MSMEATVKADLIEFSGFLNEDASIDHMVTVIQDALNKSHNKPLKLDFSNVKRANSCGILTWYKVIEQMNGKFIYINTPRWLVEQFNISDFLSLKTNVESIQANFYCPANDTHETLLLIIGKDIPILDNYDNFNLVLKNKDGLELEIDFEPSEYFYFISINPERFKESHS